MPTNRFDRPGNYDFNMEHVVPKEFLPNFEALDTTLTQFQAEKDTTEAFLDKVPQHIKQDSKALEEYVQQNQGDIDKLTSAYSNGKLSQARAEQAKLLKRIRKDWQPGGKATKFESRKAQLAAISKELDKRHKDDPGYQKEYALTQLMSSINANQIDESINDPNVGKFFDIGQELDKRLSGFKSDKGTIIKGLNGKWIYEESKEEVREGDVRAAANKILSQGQFASQLQVDSWNKGRRYDKDAFKESYLGNIDSFAEGQIKEIESMPTAQFQKFAQGQGLDIGSNRPDGIEGAKTKAARAALVKKVREEADKAKSSYDFNTAVRGVTRDEFVEPVVEKLGFSKISKSVKANPFWLVAARKKATQDLMNSVTVRPPRSLTFNAPAMAIDTENVRANLKSGYHNLRESEGALSEYLGDTPLGEHIRTDEAASVIKAYNNSIDKDGNADLDAFKKVYKGSGAEAVFNHLNGNAGIEQLSQHVDLISKQQSVVDEYENLSASINLDFNRSVEGKGLLSKLYGEVKDTKGYKNWARKNGIKTQEEFTDFMTENVDNTRDISMWTWLSSKPASDQELAIEEYRTARDRNYKANPGAYKSISPVGITGDSGTAAGEMNARVNSVPLQGFIGVNGSPLIFNNQSDRSEEFTADDIDPKSRKSFMTVRNGKPMIYMTATAKTDDGVVQVESYGVLQQGLSDGILAQSGLEMVASTLDSDGNLISDAAAVQERQFGSLQYFHATYGDDFNMSVAKSIRPNESYQENLETAVVGADGKLYSAGVSNMDNMTPVESINTGAVDMNIYTAEENGQQVYYVTQKPVGSNKHIVNKQSGYNRPKVYQTVESAVQDISEMAASQEINRTGLRFYPSKSKIRVNLSDVSQMQNN